MTSEIDEKRLAREEKEEQISAEDITTNPALEALFPKLPEQQYQVLRESIRTEGQHFPIYVNKDGVVLDGHHRLKACGEIGVKPKFIIKYFEDKVEEKSSSKLQSCQEASECIPDN